MNTNVHIRAIVAAALVVKRNSIGIKNCFVEALGLDKACMKQFFRPTQAVLSAAVVVTQAAAAATEVVGYYLTDYNKLAKNLAEVLKKQRDQAGHLTWEMVEAEIAKAQAEGAPPQPTGQPGSDPKPVCCADQGFDNYTVFHPQG